MTRALPVAIIAAALAAAVPTAFACGVCVEDKVAATYDHAVVDSPAHLTLVRIARDGRLAEP